MEKITDDAIIADVLKKDEGTGPIFLKNGMHCIGCPVASKESIKQAAATHGVDSDKLVNEINDYLESK